MLAPPILLVDSDAWALAPLEGAGYPVTHVATAAEARMHLRDAALMAMDLDLPDEDGVVFISEVREYSDIPILVFSARGGRDPALALRFGADMLAAKPLVAAELVARVGAVLRRAHVRPAGSNLLERGRLVIDQTGVVVRFDGKTVHVTPTQFRLLVALANAYGEDVSYAQLIEAGWNQSFSPSLQHMVMLNVSRIRVALRAHAATKLIANRHGFGYVLLDADYEPEKGD